MSKMRIETDYLLVLRPEPDRPGGPTLHQRMRSAMKMLLRHHGFKCVRIAPDLPSELAEPDVDIDAAKAEPPF